MKKWQVIILILLLAFVWWYSLRRAYQKGYGHGMGHIQSEVAGCTLAAAHQGKCFIPCESYVDCVDKNGHPEREY